MKALVQFYILQSRSRKHRKCLDQVVRCEVVRENPLTLSDLYIILYHDVATANDSDE